MQMLKNIAKLAMRIGVKDSNKSLFIARIKSLFNDGTNAIKNRMSSAGKFSTWYPNPEIGNRRACALSESV